MSARGRWALATWEADHSAGQCFLHGRRPEAALGPRLFIETYQANYEDAVKCLKKDRDAPLTFYDLPAEHRTHVRTTNPIESTFATVRLRHDKTKGNGTRKACLAMLFKLADAASRRWRKLKGHTLLSDVITGVRFVEAEKIQAA